MKVTKEHYLLILDQFTALINKTKESKKMTSEELFESFENHYKDYTEKRKLWDFYWASGGNNWKEIAFGSPYGGEYNDNHLTTAIKKAYNEVKSND